MKTRSWHFPRGAVQPGRGALKLSRGTLNPKRLRSTALETTSFREEMLNTSWFELLTKLQWAVPHFACSDIYARPKSKIWRRYWDCRNVAFTAGKHFLAKLFQWKMRQQQYFTNLFLTLLIFCMLKISKKSKHFFFWHFQTETFRFLFETTFHWQISFDCIKKF